MSSTDEERRDTRRRRALLAGLILAAAASLAGCTSGSPDSDIPWNVPQRWEGTPALPSGFPQQ